MDCGNADERGSTNLVFFSRISPYMVRKTKRMTGKLELSTKALAGNIEERGIVAGQNKRSGLSENLVTKLRQ